jgi:5-formyltetrahydrofolate cyclo-ligase
MPLAPDPLSQAKAAMRQSAVARRDAAQAASSAEGLIVHGLEPLAALRPRVVSGFWSIRSEIDVRPLMRALADATGALLAMPVVVGRGQALLFRRWHVAAPMIEGPFGTAHPAGSEPELVPDLLLVPLLAFDRARRRLGYGAGFYDRTLAGLRGAGAVTAVGIAYAGQEVSSLPRTAHDMPLNAVLTERGFTRFPE